MFSRGVFTSSDIENIEQSVPLISNSSSLGPTQTNSSKICNSIGDDSGNSGSSSSSSSGSSSGSSVKGSDCTNKNIINSSSDYVLSIPPTSTLNNKKDDLQLPNDSEDRSGGVMAAYSKAQEQRELDMQMLKNKERDLDSYVATRFCGQRYIRFYMLVAGILFFFGCHNYMQELIMSLPGFKIGIFLGYLEVLGVTVCSFFERAYQGESGRKSPWSAYGMLCFCLLVSSATSNIALSYINYPTKVVFRSCKLIPTMMISACYNQKKVYWFEFTFGILISMGMILFAMADFEVSPRFNYFGILLVSVSVVADAFLPNFQERVFEHGSSRGEVTFYTNVLCLAAMTVTFTATGDLQDAFTYTMNSGHACSLMALYTFLAYIAITFHMALVQEYGGIVTVLVGNTRKAITIVISFLLFPKPMSNLYIYGGILVFGSLVGNAVMKEHTMSMVGQIKKGSRGNMA